MRKGKEYLIAGSLLSLAIVGMTLVYQSETKESEEQQEQIAFQEVELEEETVEDVSNILEAENETEAEEAVETAEIAEEEEVDEEVTEPTESTSVLQFSEELLWPTEGKVIMNYCMNQTIYFKSLEQYRYNPAVIIEAPVNQEVIASSTGTIVDISNSAETGTTITMDIGSGYQVLYGQLKDVQHNVGDYVPAGQILGYVSEPTKYYSVEGSNLYFRLNKDGQPVDPMGFIAD